MAFRTKRDRKPVLGALGHALILAGVVNFDWRIRLSDA